MREKLCANQPIFRSGIFWESYTWLTISRSAQSFSTTLNGLKDVSLSVTHTRHISIPTPLYWAGGFASCFSMVRGFCLTVSSSVFGTIVYNSQN